MSTAGLIIGNIMNGGTVNVGNAQGISGQSAPNSELLFEKFGIYPHVVPGIRVFWDSAFGICKPEGMPELVFNALKESYDNASAHIILLGWLPSNPKWRETIRSRLDGKKYKIAVNNPRKTKVISCLGKLMGCNSELTEKIQLNFRNFPECFGDGEIAFYLESLLDYPFMGVVNLNPNKGDAVSLLAYRTNGIRAGFYQREFASFTVKNVVIRDMLPKIIFD